MILTKNFYMLWTTTWLERPSQVLVRLNQRSLFSTNLEIRRTAPIFMQGVPPPRSEGPAHQSRAPSCTCMRTAIYKFCSIIIMCSGSIRFWITLSAVIRLISGLLYTPSTQLKSHNWTESSAQCPSAVPRHRQNVYIGPGFAHSWHFKSALEIFPLTRSPHTKPDK